MTAEGLRVGSLARTLRSTLRKVRRRPTDVDAVHDSRVAARRLLVAGELGAFGGRRITGPLRRVVRRLGRLRNLDVALEMLERGPASDARARRALSKALLERRRREVERLAGWLTERRVRKIWRDLRHASEVLHIARGDVRTYFTGLSGVTTRLLVRLDPETAHEVRREVRRFRYAFEAAADAFPPADRRAIARLLKGAQEAAGRWHDVCVLEQFAGLAVRKEWLRVAPDRLLQRLQAHGRTQAQKFLAALRELIRVRHLFLEGDRA